MKQLNKNEFGKHVMNNVLFGSSDEIYIIEFKYNFPDPLLKLPVNLFKFNRSSTEPELIEKDISLPLLNLFNSEIIENYESDTVKCLYSNCHILPVSSTLSDKKSTKMHIYAKKSIEVKTSESVSTITDILLLEDIDIKEGEYTVNIIFTNSFCAPIIRIYKDELPLEDTLRYDLSCVNDRVSEDSLIVYNSQYSSIDTKITESKVTENKNILQTNIDFLIDKKYENSSLSKEQIEYNDHGEVIYYQNKQNGITMSKDIKHNGDYEETVKFLDTVISQTKRTTVSEDVIKIESLYDDDIIITKEDKCITKEIISKKDTTSKIIRLFDNGKTVYDDREIDCTCEYSVNDDNRTYIYPDGTKDIHFDNHIRREFKNKDISCTIIDDPRLIGYIIESSSGERLSYKSYNKLLNGSTNFESSSGIQYEFGYDNDIDTNSPIFRYKDNDVFFELGFADNGNFKLLQFKSDYFSDKYLYQRDMFGIPRLVNYER